MSALRLLLLSALAASASGYIPTLSGPVRAAEAHERGGLSPFHFKWGRRQRRELGAEGTESSGESGEHGLDEEAKEEIQDWTSTLCLVALALNNALFVRDDRAGEVAPDLPGRRLPTVAEAYDAGYASRAGELARLFKYNAKKRAFVDGALPYAVRAARPLAMGG